MLSEIFKNPKPVIGVIHLLPLPGAATWEGHFDQVVARAEQEATALASGGVDGILLENYYDPPRANERVDVAGAIAMAQIAHRIQHFTETPLGVSVLANDPQTALAVALNVNARFIRVPVLIGTMISEGGMIDGKLNELRAYRNLLKADDSVKIFADVTMNHIIPAPQRQAPWKAPLAYLKQVILAIKKHGIADALIVSAEEVTPEDLPVLRETAGLPILVCDHPEEERLVEFHATASGLLVGHSVKKAPVPGMDSRTTVDLTRIERLLEQLPAGSETLSPSFPR